MLREADEAFAALEMLIGDGEWFFGEKTPGMFDACVFAYTHLLLDGALGADANGERGDGGAWRDARLRDMVKERKALVAHQERVLRGYFS